MLNAAARKWRVVLVFALCQAGCMAALQDGPTVAIVKGTDPNEMVAKALALIGGLEGLVKEGDHVVIKPNLTYYYGPKNPRPGMTTDVRVVAGLVAALQKHAKCRITVAESSGTSTDRVFEAYGYTQLARRRGLKLVDLTGDEQVEVRKEGLSNPEYLMPKTTQTCNVLIDVPVLKTHQLSAISVGMKNWYGLLPKSKPFHRGRYHEQVDEVLSDLVQISKPHLVVVDGLVAMEGQGPLNGKGVEMNLVLAGTDVVAVDAVAAAIMGFAPDTVKHLRVAKARGLGECDLAKITIKGEPIEKVRKKFKAPVAFPYTHPRDRRAMAKFRAAAGWRGRLRSQDLKLDPKQYPMIAKYPFEASRNRGDLRFKLGCNAFERPAMVDEIRKWLAEPLPTKPEATTHPATAPAELVPSTYPR